MKLATACIVASALLSTAARAASVRSLLPAEAFINSSQVRIDDMVFDVDRLALPRGATADDGKSRPQLQAGFWAYQSRPWPGGKLPIVFGFWPEKEEINMVSAACAEWSSRAALRCSLAMTEEAAARKDEDAWGVPPRQLPLPVRSASSALLLKKLNGCWSMVGRPSGQAAAMSLGPGCWDHGVILHELGHAFGAMHEHQRPDAFQYIEIRWFNILADYHYAYLPLARDDYEESRATDYDFESVMHYGPWAFSSNGQPTFVLRPEFARFNGRVGLQNAVSQLDGEGMARLYGVLRAPLRSDAAFVSGQSPPAVMGAGEKARVSVTFRNTGKSTWTRRNWYRLGSENPRDNHVWGGHRVELDARDSIRPGQSKTFSFEITAPSKPGVYDLQVRMLQEMVTWFGDKSPNVRVEVRVRRG